MSEDQLAWPKMLSCIGYLECTQVTSAKKCAFDSLKINWYCIN